MGITIEKYRTDAPFIIFSSFTTYETIKRAQSVNPIGTPLISFPDFLEHRYAHRNNHEPITTKEGTRSFVTMKDEVK